MDAGYQSSQTCLRCGSMLRSSDLVVRQHGEWCHVRCLRPGGADRARGETAAVLCPVCGEGIASVADLDLAAGAPVHRSCQSTVIGPGAAGMAAS